MQADELMQKLQKKADLLRSQSSGRFSSLRLTKEEAEVPEVNEYTTPETPRMFREAQARKDDEHEEQARRDEEYTHSLFFQAKHTSFFRPKKHSSDLTTEVEIPWAAAFARKFTPRSSVKSRKKNQFFADDDQEEEKKEEPVVKRFVVPDPPRVVVANKKRSSLMQKWFGAKSAV
jgi:hypothetical protein